MHILNRNLQMVITLVKEKIKREELENAVTVNIGKKGLTENVINEINMLLEKRGIVRVKMLRNFRLLASKEKDKKELIKEIASKVNGKLVDARGFVLVFKRC